MELVDHQFILKISGSELDKVSAGSKTYNRSTFNQVEYHTTMKDAFESLLREKVGLFEKNSKGGKRSRKVF